MTRKSLNPQQRRAADCVDAPVCILASAGCGKTTVLVEHYLQLIERKRLRPSQIVVTTFSEKSAGDIKQSLLKALREKGDEGLVDEFAQAPLSTLHGLGGRILRDASLLLGIDPRFNILDENDSSYLKKQCVGEALARRLDVRSLELKLLISAYGWRNLEDQFCELLNDWPEWKERFASESASEDASERALGEAWRSLFMEMLGDYEARKREREALDFNDLEEKAIELLRSKPWVLRHYQNQWKAFLVDEFQDTSGRQDALLSLLLGIHEAPRLPASMHLAIVGDPKQSIYGFRGAKAHIFEKFQQIIEASGGQTVLLDENYRSPRGILNFVNRVFAGVFPNYSHLLGSFDDAACLEILEDEAAAEDGGAEERRRLEAERFASRAEELLEEGFKPSDIFLLFRTSSPMPLYLKAFRQKNLPVFVKSGESLLQSQEVLDLLHAMRVLVDPKNALAWIGLLRSPAFGLSDEELVEFRLDSPESTDWAGIHPLAVRLLEQTPAQSPCAFLEWWLGQSHLVSLYAAEPSLQAKAQNLLQFYNLCFEWEAKHGGDLKEFLEEIDTLSERGICIHPLSDRLNTQEAVTFMTIHQSKGLNLPIVFLPDLKSPPSHSSRSLLCASDESWGLKLPDPRPGLKKSLKPSALFAENVARIRRREQEEENRVFYVATTRSMKKLVLGFLPPPPPEAKDGKKREKAGEVPRSLDALRKAVLLRPPSRWIGPAAKSERRKSSPSAPACGFEVHPRFSHARQLHFAVTQLECFSKSPQEYLKRYVYQIPAEASASRGAKDGGLGALERGQILHEALHLLSQQELPYAELIEAVAAKHHLAPSHSGDLESLREILARACEHENFRLLRGAKESYSEIAFRLLLAPFTLQGAMDRLLHDGKEWQVVDFKSHWLSPQQALPPAEDFEFQLKTYCLAAGKMLDEPVRRAQVYFMLPNKTHCFDFSQQQLDEHEIHLRNLMEEINKLH